MTQSSSPFQYLLDQQAQMFDNWSEMTTQMNDKLFNGTSPNGKASKKNGAETMTEFFESWYKQQQEMAKSTFGMFQKTPTNNMILFTPEQLKSQFDMMQNWFEQYKEMLTKAGVNMPMTSMAEQVTKMGHQLDQFTKIYSQIAHFWEPFTKMVEQGMSAEKIMKEWMQPDTYRKMFDSMMGAMNMETVWEKASKMQAQFKDFMDNFQAGEMPHLSEAMGTKPWFDMMQQMNEQAQRNLAPFSQSLTRSRESEMLKLLQDLGVGMSDYTVKIAELQTSYYQTSYEALAETVKTSLGSFEESKEMPTFEDFFKKYLDKLEYALTAAFETDEYGKLQGEVAQAGAQLQNKMGKITELMFVGTPFTMRSQTEDLVAELQTLKRKVRSLEKQLAEEKIAALPAAKPTAKATTKRATATAKK